MYAVSGPLFQAISFKVFPWFALISYIAMVLAFVVYQKILVKDGKSFYAWH
jgi:hypothetical protein